MMIIKWKICLEIWGKCGALLIDLSKAFGYLLDDFFDS